MVASAGVQRTFWQRAAALETEGRRFALVTVVRTAGSTPRKAGARMLVVEGGEIIGTIGGGRLEHELAAEAQAALTAGEPRLVRRHLTRELAMCCGGEVEAFIDPQPRREALVVVGGGQLGRALAPIGAQLGFELIVVDEMDDLVTAERFPDARLVHDWDPRAWGVPLGDRAYVVIATRDHAIDEQVLLQLAQQDARPRYLGVIGSRGKLGRFRRRLEARGVAAGWFERIRGPIGVAVGAETPEEIAVAVAAELVGVRRAVP
jgi:xanthine dehydrogenase accessory factor